MKCRNNGIDYENSQICGRFCYNGTPVLSYEICVPTVKTSLLFDMTQRVNSFYRSDGATFLNNLKLQQYPNAAKAYRLLSPSGEFTCRTVRRDYTEMYSRLGISSIFFDTYCALGEGTQKLARVSHTFSAKCGRMKLCNFFKQGYNYRDAICLHIYGDICHQAEISPHAFYNDWRNQLKCCFDEQNYYLADDGFVIFFPQRTLAPLNSGVMSFLVPYSVFGSQLICEL